MAGKTVSVPEGVEAWKNCNAGVLYYRFYDQANRERVQKVKGGGIIRLTAAVRQVIQEAYVDPRNDIFVNGTLKRVDNRISEAPADAADVPVAGLDSEPVKVEDGKTSLPEGYDPESAVDDDDLLGLLEKSGAPFQHAVKKLPEGKVRRLKKLMDSPENGDRVRASQKSFIESYVSETFVHGKSSKTVLDLQGETPSGR